MITSPLLSSILHRAMTTPVSPLHTKAVGSVLKSRFRLQLRAFTFFGFGSGSNISKFLALASEEFGPKNQKKTCIICITRLPLHLYNSLAPQTISVDPEPKFQAPAPQPCCALRLFMLARVAGQLSFV